MTKNEFVENIIFHLFKDKPYDDAQYLKSIFKQLLGCDYDDSRINDCYVKIINYQIKKYGCSLYCFNGLQRR